MWAVVSGIIQIIYLVLKNKFEKDAELKAKKKELYEEAKTVVKSGDVGAINNLVTRLRQ